MSARINSIILELHKKTKMAPNKLDVLFRNDIEFFIKNTQWDNANVAAATMIKVKQYLLT